MRIRIAIAIASIGGGVSGVHAQQIEPSLPTVSVRAERTGEGYAPAGSSTAAKSSGLSLRDIPQTVNVVPPDLLQDQAITSLQEALRNVPGVSQDAGDGQRDQFVIRGFSAVNDMYLDGMRDDSYYFRDLSNIDRIEVLKGPSSVLYGRGSSGGLINRVTKRPLKDAVRQVSIQASSAGQRRGEFDLGTATQDDSMRFRLTGALEDSDGFRDHYFLKRQALAPSVQFNLSKQTSLLIQADYLKDNRLADTGIPAFGSRPAEVRRGAYYGSADAEEQNNVSSEVAGTSMTLEHQFSDRIRFKSALRVYDSTVERNYATFGAINTTARTIQVNRATRLRNETGAYWQNELTHQFEMGGLQHQALYGLELSHQRKKDRGTTVRNVASYRVFDPQQISFPAIPANAPLNPDARTEIDLVSFYFQDLISLSQRWKLMVGGRYDRLSTNRHDDGTGNLDLKRTDTPFSPRVGIVYSPADWASIYAVMSRSFQPLADNGELRRNSADFAPEKTTNKEIGVKVDALDNASVTVSVFEMQRTGILMDDPTDTRFSIPAGTQRTRGLELSFAGTLGSGWSIYGGYALMDGVMVDAPNASLNGNASPLTPRSSVNIWLKKQLANGFYVAGGAKYESKRYTSPTNVVSLGAYTALSTSIGYRSAKYDVTFNIENLLDRRYFVAAKAGSDNSNYPGAPRYVSVKVDYRF